MWRGKVERVWKGEGREGGRYLGWGVEGGRVGMWRGEEGEGLHNSEYHFCFLPQPTLHKLRSPSARCHPRRHAMGCPGRKSDM